MICSYSMFVVPARAVGFAAIEPGWRYFKTGQTVSAKYAGISEVAHQLASRVRSVTCDSDGGGADTGIATRGPSSADLTVEIAMQAMAGTAMASAAKSVPLSTATAASAAVPGDGALCVAGRVRRPRRAKRCAPHSARARKDASL